MNQNLKALARVSYDNQLFQMFVDEKNYNVFLKVIKKEGKEMYTYPSFHEALHLNAVSNKPNAGIYYDQPDHLGNGKTSWQIFHKMRIDRIHSNE